MEGVGLTCLSTALNNPPGQRNNITQKNMFTHKPIMLFIYFSQAFFNIITLTLTEVMLICLLLSYRQIYVFYNFPVFTFYTINCIFYKAFL